MGSAKARPFQLEQKYKLKNLGKKGPTCENGTRWRRGAAQRAQRDGSGNREAGKGTERELGGRKKGKRSIKSWKSKENRERKQLEKQGRKHCLCFSDCTGLCCSLQGTELPEGTTADG